MNNNDNYKFTGVINLFGIYPDFVYPIFENNGKYYFQRSETGTITSFKEIKENLHVKMIRFLDTSLLNVVNKKYCVGDDQVMAFQIDKNNFFVSSVHTFASFIRNFDTDDNILSEEIDIFLDMVNRKNNLAKKKAKNR